MKKKCWVAVALLISFVLWTVAVRFVDVAAIGPRGSSVGFAAINKWFHHVTGAHMTLYNVTDWLGLIPVVVGVGFALLGVCQWIRRGNLFKVDYDLLLLGGFYIVTTAAYLLFEMVVINYRPVLIEGYLEASYPSSTTLLVLCVMPTAAMRFYHRIRHPFVRLCVTVGLTIFTVFMVIGRLLSGVHWLTDIIGAVLLGSGLVMLYDVTCYRVKQ